MKNLTVGERVAIAALDGSALDVGTVKALKVEGWPQGWALVQTDRYRHPTIAPVNRLIRS